MPTRKKSLVDAPVQDVFEGRHPSDSEKQWAEKTLAPALEKSPERPIGAASGVNLDEQGNARFTTISGYPVRRLVRVRVGPVRVGDLSPGRWRPLTSSEVRELYRLTGLQQAEPRPGRPL